MNTRYFFYTAMGRRKPARFSCQWGGQMPYSNALADVCGVCFAKYHIRKFDVTHKSVEDFDALGAYYDEHIQKLSC